MPLNLYRRHFRIKGKCTGKHTPDSRNYEPEELRRGWRKCGCPIYACGTLGPSFIRRNTKAVTWEQAKAVAAVWQAAGTWEAAESAALPSAPQKAQAGLAAGVTIKQATDAYTANREGRKIADSTLRKYKTLTKQLLTFADERGYVMLPQFSVPDMDLFYGSWKDGIRAKGKKLERLKGFFKFCVKRKWISENVAENLEAPIGAGSAANRLPFSDAELTKIYEACDRLPTVSWKSGMGTGEWGGEDVKAFIMLLCWTGLRISDAATFDMGRVTPHPEGGANVFLRMHKTKGALFTWVDDWLYERLQGRERALGLKIFTVGTSQRLETVTDLWRRKINRVFDLAAPFECGVPTPHIFRHTFVRLLLQRGVSPRDVADLIGDTEDMVLKHYARWVPERQERLTNILREKLSTAPRPKLLVVPGGKAATQR